ncbi:hypothetical protein RclHR1_00460009 [Rhizophagus clarus]|uniref:Uncharacterized protein n=1 Tax=Rhizophagus clarus TaxID=94130 RepID=A0A2Z6RJS0_9GLOM|nr:hypothetical protein RclHR1_00460009 [Rhizophagus clarus]
MVNAQTWFDEKYPIGESKRAVQRIGPKEYFLNRIIDNLISVLEGRPLKTLFLGLDANSRTLSSNLNLEGSLTLKGFLNLEILDISNQNISVLNISDCPQLRELNCTNNQLTSLSISGLNKIQKIFCSYNELKSLDFLKSLNPATLLTLRMGNNKFHARDLKCFTPFINLRRLFICNNPFYGSLKPLRNLFNLKEIGIAGTNIDSGLEYLPDDFFYVNAIASGFNLGRGYYLRMLFCTGKLFKQLENYKIEGDPFRNYDWQTWKQDNQELINKAKEDVDMVNQDHMQTQQTNIIKELEEVKEENKVFQDQILMYNNLYEALVNKYNYETDKHLIIIEKLRNDIKEIEEKYQNKINDIGQYQNYVKLQKYVDLQEKYNKEINQNQIIVEKLRSDIERIEEKYQNQISEIDQQYQNKFKLQEQRINQLQQSLELKENKLQDLGKEKEELNVEYDNLHQKDANLVNQLINILQQNTSCNDDISNYQLENIDMEKIKKLLLLYECSIKITNQKDDQLLIQAVLQRHIIETILLFVSERGIQ